MSGLEFRRFTPSEIPGVIVVNAFAIVATLALLTVVFRVTYLALRRFVFKLANSQSREYVFFNTVLGNYAACLLIANIINGVAGLMGLQQLMKGGIQEGSLCTTQAIVMQVGTFASAYFTVAIGVHTFNSLVLSRRQSTLICVVTVSTGWIATGVIAAAPMFQTLALGPRYGISGLSCGIRTVYPKSMFFFHLFPILLCSIISALLYSLIFLVLRGTLVIRGGLKLSLDPQDRWAGNVQNYHRFVARIARSMLWFPIAYILFLVPYSATRLIDVSGRVCPFPLLVTAYVFWFMLGVANVLTLYNTLSVLGPAFDARSTGQKDLESATSGTRNPVMAPMIAAGGQYYSRASQAMSEKSRPDSLNSFNQVQPTPSENPAAHFRLQPPPLAARIQDRREEYYGQLQRTHTRTDSERSDWTSAPSYYDYGMGSTLEADAAAASPPKTRLSQLILNAPVISSAPSVRSTQRLPPSQQPPNQSLPAPPRSRGAVLRPAVSHRPVTIKHARSHGSLEARYSSMSIQSEQFDDRPEGYMPHGLISAVGNSYNVPAVSAQPLPVFDRSQSVRVPGPRERDVRAPRLSTPEPPLRSSN
ncbi:hypothetical protein GGX14DRAFT_493392 [Mycena pura]|uniref:G-protein coupled receptors family 1 profile domain-containing protein n=1 Tax=Mycena pura TaxID=153505 RepID=A0AAD6YH81_9AGAR|nr:hypothetical protein GGX14DRAFT_493392 [Mycena pura]